MLKPVLDGRFVRLEPLEERHRAAIRPAAQHPEIFTVTSSAYGPLYDPYIDNALKRSDGVHETAFAVLLKSDNRYVGMTRYLNIEAPHKRLEIGSTWYEPSVWAGAVNPECKLLLMRHAFETLKFHRVEYKTDARNARSRAAIAEARRHPGRHLPQAHDHGRRPRPRFGLLLDRRLRLARGEGGIGETPPAMSRYLASRAVQTVVTLALMSFVVYLLIGLMPGDPIDMMIAGDPNMKSEDAARLRAVYGLDRPLLERYAAWAWQALQGNFGYSRTYSQPVLAVLWPRLINTFVLAGLAFVIAVAIALPLGIWAASRPRSRIDYLINLLCFGGISTPPFWLALLLITLFAVKLGWLPAGGQADIRPGTSWFAALGDRLRYLALPVFTLVLVQVGGYTRFMRGAMIEVLRQDYIRTARAKGLPEGRVRWGHAFSNALAPVLTILALSFGGLFSGALITETMFAWPGMGKAIYQAILENDYNLALVGLLIATLATMLGNLLADLAYAWVDPRVSIEQSA